jgi:hypothetical protein
MQIKLIMPNSRPYYLEFYFLYIQGGSDMTGTNCDLFTHNQSRSYLNQLVYIYFGTCSMGF